MDDPFVIRIFFFFDHCFGDTILRESSTCTINIIQDARYSIVSEQVHKYNIPCGMTLKQ